MKRMKWMKKIFLCCTLGIIMLTMSCAQTKTLHVWKDNAYGQISGKVLIIIVADNDNIRSHFENVLAEKLAERNIPAVASHKVFPQTEKAPDRELVMAKVKELGIGSVIVGRPISREDFSSMTEGGTYLVPQNYYAGYYSVYSDSMSFVTVPGSSYDAEFFTLAVNLYDVPTEKLVWSFLSRVKVEQSRQAAVNPFIDTLMRQFQSSGIVK